MKQTNEASAEQIKDYLHSCGGNELRSAIAKLTTPCLAILNEWIGGELSTRLVPEKAKKNDTAH